MGSVDTSDLDHCPYCSKELNGFGCVRCNVEFIMDRDTETLVEKDIWLRRQQN